MLLQSWHTTHITGIIEVHTSHETKRKLKRKEIVPLENVALYVLLSFQARVLWW